MVRYDMNDSLSIDITKIPQGWIYKAFYEKMSNTKIYQPFDGRTIKVKSLINSDTDPSLCFFYKNGYYLWRDFSQGVGGGPIKFVSYHLNKHDAVAHDIIKEEYQKYLDTGEEFIFAEGDHILKPEYKITTMPFNDKALDWWKQYKISIETLNWLKVKNNYEYQIFRGDTFAGFANFAFIYYCNKGPFQIYQPGNKVKYLQLDTTYLIGSEQLEFKSDTCVIISGLKDIAAIKEVGLSCEYVAPPSETILIKKEKIEFLRSKYKYIISMLDNDKAGLRSMRLYKATYGIPYVHIPLQKDLADNNKNYPLEKLRYIYTAAINKKINAK